MPARRLSADESALWAKVMASVRPIRVAAATRIPSAPPANAVSVKKPVVAKPAVPSPSPAIIAAKHNAPGITLDGGWDRKIARGIVMPDSSIDLHGHNLASAHALLDAGLGRAIARGDRVLLLVTGKPPRPESERPHARGAIRAAVTDWLAVSRHAGSIAAVRGAHPRHGGSGALYLVLRRPRDSGRNP